MARLSFEEALAELESLVRRLEDGKAGLEESIAAYERGALLRNHCEKKLRDANERIEQITDSDENPSLSPLVF